MESSDKFLNFFLGSESFAVSIKRVREIIMFEKITPVREALKYLKGVINLRGKIIPIIDLRIKFGMDEIEYNDRTVFIIVDIYGENGIYNIGMAVDSVSDVTDVDLNDVEKTPEIGLKLKSQYLEGIAKIQNKMAMILNIDKILSSDDIIKIQTEEQKAVA